MPASPVLTSSSRTAYVAVLALTVVVFGGAVAAVTLQLRAGIRDQILRREAAWLEAIASMQLADQNPELPGALDVAVLKTEKLAGVFGLRIFDGERKLISMTGVLSDEVAAPQRLWQQLGEKGAFGRLHTRLSEDETDLFLIPPSATMLEAWVPLRINRSGRLLGAAQFWRDGADLQAELSAHDRRVFVQAAVAWLAGSLVIALALGWALRRVNDANRKLRLRSEDLLRANRELVLAAKTSALGAVTAHLMHELKNPLAGLETIVAGQSENSGRSEAGTGGGELAAASELTRRLRTMVNDVVGVLRDEQTGAEFELTCADIAEVAAGKVQSEAKARGVTIKVEAASDVPLSGRRANLVTLVLRNLLQNALEATPTDGTVWLRGSARGHGMEFLVEDGGAGLPDAVRARLFQPCASTKVGGSGLGLALSYQLAQQAGGRLELVRSNAAGTCFRLELTAEA